MEKLKDKWNYFWGGLTKKAKILLLAVIVILIIVIIGQF